MGEVVRLDPGHQPGVGLGLGALEGAAEVGRHKTSMLQDLELGRPLEIEALLGTKVYLDLHVKVLKEWQRDPKMLGRLGF